MPIASSLIGIFYYYHTTPLSQNPEDVVELKTPDGGEVKKHSYF